MKEDRKRDRGNKKTKEGQGKGEKRRREERNYMKRVNDVRTDEGKGSR